MSSCRVALLPMDGRMVRRSKYNARKTIVDGITFDSKHEADVWCRLKLREKAGEIANLERQVRFDLSIEGRPILIRSKGFPNGRKAKFTVDFAYTDVRLGKRVFLDAKGLDTEASRLRRAVVEAIFPGVIIELC